MLLICGLSTLGLGTHAQLAHPIVTVHLERFPARAHSWAGFHREMSRRERLDSRGSWRYAITSWKMSARDKIEISVDYPKIVSRGADNLYQKSVRSIAMHEIQHRQITEAVFRRCQGLPMLEISHRIYLANAEFDRLSDHGRKIVTMPLAGFYC